MKEITKLMITEFAMKDMDWMGYKLQKGDMFTYHHTRVFRRDGGIEDRKNGSILCGNTSHPYLHLIEYQDPESFGYLTNILIQINNQGFMPTIPQLLAIDSILLGFEDRFSDLRGKKGKLLIKKEYKERTQVDLRKR